MAENSSAQPAGADTGNVSGSSPTKTVEASETGLVAAPLPTSLIAAAQDLVEESGTKLAPSIKLEWMGPQRGFGIVARTSGIVRVKAGDVLIEGVANGDNAMCSNLDYPWESDSFRDLLDHLAQAPDTGAPGSGRLQLRLALLLIKLARNDKPEAPKSVLEKYIAALPEVNALQASQWPRAGREWLRGSVQYKRANDAANDLEKELKALRKAMPENPLLSEPPVTAKELREAYMRAAALVSSRAFETGSTSSLGVVLLPVLDFLNHCCVEEANAKVKFDGANFRLEALSNIRNGQELLICYDPEADYMDLWERYGFFDTTANILTAEIYVSESSEWHSRVGTGPHWIPEAHENVPLTCPLQEAIMEVVGRDPRCKQMGEEEVQGQILLVLAELIEEHLVRSRAEVEDQKSQPCSEDIAPYQQVAEKVLRFEHELLEATRSKCIDCAEELGCEEVLSNFDPA